MKTPNLNSILSSLVSAWNNFWYRPMSTLTLAIFRVAFGALLIQYGLLLIPDLFVWFGKNGIISSETVNSWNPYVHFNLLNLFPNNDTWMIVVFTLFMIASLFLTTGFLTKASSVIVFLCLNSFHARAFLIINSGDNFMRLLSFWLIFSPAGKSFSIDHLLRLGKNNNTDFNAQTNAAPWAQRLMQINMTLLYAQTFAQKIVGRTWQNGTAVYYSSRMQDMQHFPSFGLFEHFWICKLLTWTTLAIELSLCTLIWIRPIRYYVLAAGILMHLVIDWTMNIPQFEWVMICSYILFINPKDLSLLMNLNLKERLMKLVSKFKLP